MSIEEFQELVWQKGNELFRPMPWREDTRPYYVLVSELMLQQTQVERVIPKFQEFIRSFPTIGDLASSSLEQVLQHWSGLGYNRRAKFLWESAKMVQHDFNGIFPETAEGLVRLPGVGKNTAGAIMAYSFNRPVVYIETNIRTVFFYHFFEHNEQVTDAELLAKATEMLDHEHSREWYWALMDYGSHLKRQGIGLNSKSAHYKRQAPLKGSVREVRGQIIKQLTQYDMYEQQLKVAVQADERFEKALSGLRSDGLVSTTGERLHLSR